MIYLASPYSDPDSKVMDQRYNLICEACAALARRGFNVYSPIVHWHVIAKRFNLSKKYSFWKKHDEEMIKICNDFWVLTIHGWNTSKGVANESAYAVKQIREIKYITLPECIS